MGADGGTVAKRSELVTTVDSREGITKLEDEKKAEWVYCALTGERLEDPVVSDWNGSLYNKTAILRYLLGDLPPKYQPRTSLAQIRDVVELHREFCDGEWIDPITRKVLATEGGSEGFAYIPDCGHIGVSKILQNSSCCPLCEQSYEDIVMLNPRTIDAENNNKVRHAKLERLGLSNTLRPRKVKAKKRKREEDGRRMVKPRPAPS